MLYYETIAARTLTILKKLQGNPIFKEMRLVGGTALALQIGHRRSVDLDLFGSLNIDKSELDSEIEKVGNTLQLKSSKNIHVYLIDNVKVDIVNYNYPWLDKEVRIENLIMASKRDIAAMKISAITGGGSKKDFIDLYFLLQEFTLAEILAFYLTKYADGSKFIALKSLGYFEDAEIDPMPEMLRSIAWEDVKKYIVEIQRNF